MGEEGYLWAGERRWEGAGAEVLRASLNGEEGTMAARCVGDWREGRREVVSAEV